MHIRLPHIRYMILTEEFGKMDDTLAYMIWQNDTL